MISAGADGDPTFYNLRGRDVEFAFYGWSGRPLYPTSETGMAARRCRVAAPRRFGQRRCAAGTRCR